MPARKLLLRFLRTLLPIGQRRAYMGVAGKSKVLLRPAERPTSMMLGWPCLQVLAVCFESQLSVNTRLKILNIPRVCFN